MKAKTKSVLVSGGAGFIGSHLCERLLDLGHIVINLDNFNDFYDPFIKRNNILTARKNLNYAVQEGDIRDSKLLDSIFNDYDIDAVVHLAALAGVRTSLEEPGEYVDVDVKGTVNLMEACRKHNIEKFVFASSSSVYGVSPPPFREDNPLLLQASPYACAKLAGEIFSHTWHYLYGIPTVCLRFFTMYGPRQRPEMAIHKFTRLIDQELEIALFGDGGSMRDYTYIDDIIDGIIASLRLNCSFETFNLGNAAPIRLLDLIRIIESKLDKRAVIKPLPFQQGDVEITWADLEKSQRQLGYCPKVSIEEGIEKFIDWYRK